MRNLITLFICLVGLSTIGAFDEHHYHNHLKHHHPKFKQTTRQNGSEETDSKTADGLTFSFNSSSLIGSILNITAQTSAVIDIKANVSIVFDQKLNQLIAINYTSQSGKLLNATNITGRIEDLLTNATSILNNTAGLTFNSSALPQEVQAILNTTFPGLNCSKALGNLQIIISSIRNLPLLSQINCYPINGLKWLVRRFEGLSKLFENFKDRLGNQNITIDLGKILQPIGGTRTFIEFLRQLNPFFNVPLQSLNLTQFLPVIQQIGGNSSGFDSFIKIILQFGGNSTNCTGSELVNSLIKFFTSTQNISQIQHEFNLALKDGLESFLPINSSLIVNLLHNNTNGFGDNIIKFLASLDQSNVYKLPQTFLPFLQNIVKNSANPNGLLFLRQLFPCLNITQQELTTVVNTFKTAAHNSLSLAQNGQDILGNFAGVFTNPFFSYLNTSIYIYSGGSFTIPEFFKPSNLGYVPSFFIGLANLTVNTLEDGISSFLNIVNPEQANNNQTNNHGPFSELLNLVPGTKHHHTNKEHTVHHHSTEKEKRNHPKSHHKEPLTN